MNPNTTVQNAFRDAVCGDLRNPEAVHKAAVVRAGLYAENRNDWPSVWNSNTVDVTLKRDAILQVVVGDFARKLLPLNFDARRRHGACTGNAAVSRRLSAVRARRVLTESGFPNQE